jgi:31-O-methyltransferase
VRENVVKARHPKLVKLPDSTLVWAPNAVEARVLYHELGQEGVYSRYGIQVLDGGCVFDVGANIGLYSVLLMRAHARLRIFAFEPVAPVYAMLERNITLHQRDAVVTLFNNALGRQAGLATGELDPGLSFAASLRAQDVAGAIRPGISLVQWAQALLPDLARSGQLSRYWADRLQWGLASTMLRPLAVGAVLSAAAAACLRAGGGLRKRAFTCQVRTLSEVITEYAVGRIDVLKIDVEGSEWEVLAGIDREHWARIQQVVVSERRRVLGMLRGAMPRLSARTGKDAHRTGLSIGG